MGLAEWIAFGVAIALMIAGVLGTVIPVLPGLPLIWGTMLVFGIVEGFERIDAGFLWLFLAVTVAAEVADHLARAWGARRYGAGRVGTWGALLGSIVGLFFLPLGLVLGPFLGVLVAELLSGRTLDQSMRAGWGGLIGALGSIAVKLVVGVGMTIAFVVKVL